MYPKLISIGHFFIPTYGVLVAIAFLVALAITVRLGRRAGIDPERITNLAIYCALMGLLGAKVLMVLFDLPRFIRNPGELFSWDTLQAAGVYFGGLLLAIGFALLYARHFKMPWLQTADVFAPGIAIGHSIGKVGCFAAGCCWGTPTNVPWAVTFTSHAAHDLVGVPLYVPLHPAQLYESATELITFGLVYWRIGKKHRPGEIIGLYLVVSSALRFFVEFFRNHEQALPFGLPLSITQWIALGLIVAGALLLWRPRAMGRTAMPATAK
jgi:phosphatidylglycerol---prolipoprotein diacylglyceryl transferase